MFEEESVEYIGHCILSSVKDKQALGSRMKNKESRDERKNTGELKKNDLVLNIGLILLVAQTIICFYFFSPWTA